MILNIKLKSIWVSGILFLVFLSSCEDFVDIDVPDHKISNQTVFAKDETALSAMNGVYNQLFNTSFSSGGNRSVTFLAGLTSDDLEVTTSDQFFEFAQNEITTINIINLDLWSGTYNMIYMANSILGGIENSSSLSEGVRKRLEGEAKFVRAFSYFYLANLYGDVPLILNTDYHINSTMTRDSSEEVFIQIVSDLEDAIVVLDNEYKDGERAQINQTVVKAFLARVHLFSQNWEEAKVLSSEIISQTSTYEILEDLDQVFLANSKEAIWQISPIGWGNSFIHTHEGNIFIKTSSNSNLGLSNNFMESWEPEDRRLHHWVGNYTDNTGIYYYPYKYKVQFDDSGGSITEYSMVMRLAEQYLIRAEARAHQGDVLGAIADLNVLRKRAGLELLTNTATDMPFEALLDMILRERRAELFMEWGHRWLDLIRTKRSTEVLSPGNSNWQDTDVLYPIPEDERMKNSNLNQNPGY